MAYMKVYINKYWKGFLTAVLFVTLEALCDLMQPTIMSKIVDFGVANKNLNYVIDMGGVMLLVTGGGAINVINLRKKFGFYKNPNFFYF